MTSHRVNEAIIYAKNNYGLMVYLDFDVYNALVKKRINGTWDKEKAITLIAKYFVPSIVKNYKKEFESSAISQMPMSEKREVAEYLLTRLWDEGGFKLSRNPLKYVREGDSDSRVRMDISQLSKTAIRRRYECL